MKPSKSFKSDRVADGGRRAAHIRARRLKMTLTLTPPQPMVYGRARHPKGAVCRHLAHPAIYGVYHSNSKVVTVRGAHNPKCSLYTLNRYI